MSELNKLRGLSPVSPASNRVWKAPRERKPGDRLPRKRKQKGTEDKDAREKAEQATSVPETNAEAVEEIELPLEYGADGLKKRPRRKVDVEV